MRTVVAATFPPSEGSGRGLRTIGVLSALLAHGAVHVVYVPFGDDPPSSDLLARDDLTTQTVVPARDARRALEAARAIAGERMPPTLARAVSRELRDATSAALHPGDRLVADGPTAAGTLLGVARTRPAVYLAHNLETSFRSTPLLRSFERRVLETYAETWMCTRADIDGARRLAPRAGKLRYVPNVVRMPAAAPAPGGGRRVLMLADYRYEPNAEAVAWLVREVLPRVREAVPDVRLDLAGRELPEGLADGRAVHELGFVADLAATYAAADVVAVPLLRGGGSPLKFVEALSYGKPVVATRHAASLLEDGVPGEHFLAADGAQAYADALVTALRDGDGDLGRRGRALVREHLSVQALEAAVAP